ncbi:MAG: ATP-dependent helicase [Candidatus Gastranaerophilales bacterium]|nr:ATP-dependent helicase [Candidatus Gastranaerophilales bacterium]
MITINEGTKNTGIKPNNNQQKCIEYLDGPVMVLAGPGTGKTYTVIERIKYMLANNIAPESILCLTYSEAAAGEMKTRLVKEVGADAAAVAIHTYHAFCNEVIKFNPAEFELLEGLSLADDIIKQTIMAECVKEYKPEYHLTKWGESDYYVPELLNDVDKIKKSLITKTQYFSNLQTHPLWQGKMNELDEELKERTEKNKPLKSFMIKYNAHKKKMGKAKEAWEIYEIYDKKLKQNNFIDFNDMINMVLEVFETNEELLKNVSKKFKYFLVDEYQDTNYAQNSIVFKLAEGAGNDNIFVVGDDDQIIYEFQGAKTDTLEKFLKKFPQTEVICLDENNRSTQTILDFSYKVISQDKTRLEYNPEFKKYNIKKSLTAKNKDICINDRPVKMHCFAESSQEMNFITDEIEQLINSSSAPKNNNGEIDLSAIAILTRENSELENYAELLKSKNIRYQIKTTNSIFDMKPSILIYFYLKTLYNHSFYSEKLFGLLGAEPFAFEPEDYMFLLSQNRLNHKDFIENIRLNLDYDWKNKEKVLRFIQTYDKLKRLQTTENIKNLIVSVCNETGILEYYVNSDVNKVENILAIKRIIDEAGTYKRIHKSAGLRDFIEHLDTACRLNIPITIDKDDYVQNAIQLVTLHGSKGRQFDYVYMPNLTAGKWEKKRNRNDTSLPIIDETKFIDDDTSLKSEQLRLLFVGITRTKYNLTISYPNVNNGRAEEFTSHLSDIVKNSDMFEVHTHELSKEEYSLELAKTFRQKQYDYKGALEEEIRLRTKNIILSPSTLNSYLACPREFFYTYVLKIPVFENDWDNANYGSAVHRTLESAVISLKTTGKYPDKTEFLEIFSANLDKEEFETGDVRETYRKRGLNSLEKFYPHFIETSSDRIDKVEYTLDTVLAGDNIITGKIDRVEKNPDGTYCLFDYKTGSAKPKSQIADGKEYESYLNQLRFYKYAFESLHTGSKVSMVGLMFPEECDRNFYTELTQQDNDYIKSKIDEVYNAIRSMEFEPAENNDDNCKYCTYRQLCKLNVI